MQIMPRPKEKSVLPVVSAKKLGMGEAAENFFKLFIFISCHVM